LSGLLAEEYFLPFFCVIQSERDCGKNN